MNFSVNKAVLLERVSSEEQQQGHSISAQHDRLTHYAQSKGFHIIRVFEIIESSTQGKRKEYHAMINYIKRQDGCIAVIVDAVDRIQRGFKESIELDELRKQRKIELHFLRESIVLNEHSDNHDIMMWDFAVLGAKSYVLSLSQNVKRSIEFRVRSGQWMGRAPVGYLNVRDPATDKAHIVLDKARAYLVKKCFELYATGVFSIRSVVKKMKKEGLTNPKTGKPLSLNQIDRLLKNSFYYGEMIVKGKIYPHKYEPIVDIVLFSKCQQVRASWNKKPFKYQSKPFIFRGLIKCADCGRSISFDQKKGKYIYAFCTQYKKACRTRRIREEIILEQIFGIFKAIKVPETTLVEIRDKLKASHEAKMLYHNEAIKNLNDEYSFAQKKLDRLLDMNLEQSITQTMYIEKQRILKNQQYEIEVRLKEYTTADETFGITVSYLLDLSSKASELFQSSKIDQKRKLISFVLSNLRLDGKKLLYDLKKPFDALVECSKSLEWGGLRDSNP